MAYDAPLRPAGTPGAVDSIAQLHSSMSMSPSARDRAPKRVISPPKGSDRYKRLDSRQTPKKPPRDEMQLVTPQGEEDDVVPRRLWRTLPQSLAVELASVTSAAAKAAAREKAAAARKARYEELDLPYTPAPPLPDGATDEDRARLRREALNRYYGY